MLANRIEACPINRELYTQGAEGRSRAKLKSFRVLEADRSKGFHLLNSEGKHRRITLQEVHNFDRFLLGEITAVQLRKDVNTSYLFGIHAAILEETV